MPQPQQSREATRELRNMKIILVIAITLCLVLGVFVVYTIWLGREAKDGQILPRVSEAYNIDAATSSVEDESVVTSSQEGEQPSAPSKLVKIKNVAWEYGFKKLSDEETLMLMRQRVPTQSSTQIVTLNLTKQDIAEMESMFMGTPARCEKGSTDLLCHLVVYKAGVIQSDVKEWNNKVLYRFFFPAVQSNDLSISEKNPVYNSESFFGVYNNDGLIHVFKTDQYSQPWKTFPQFVGDDYSVSWGDAVIFVDTPPQTLSTVRTDGILEFKDATTIFGGLQGFTLIDHSVYTSKNKVGTFPQGTLYAMDGGVYHLVYPHGEVLRYDLLPYFLKQHTPTEAEKNMYITGYDTDITWTDGRTRTDDAYIVGGRIGRVFCASGILPCTNVVTTTEWFKADNLITVGKTTRGESVYELKNAKDNILYRELFDFGFSARQIALHPGEQIDYTMIEKKNTEYMAEFLADHPIFFWKDEKGEWRFYQKAGYQSMAECGKPVIYLYPEKTSTIRVQVDPTGGFTKVEPEYPKGGWVVDATPESILMNKESGNVYPYLFWEGIAYNYIKPTQGFVFKKDDVPSKMRALLKKTGMNEKETKDFMEFWEEKLMVKPYVFVTLVPQAEFDRMAPLTIEPQPETVIRVFMDYTPLDAPIKVEPLRIETPIRKGFTVVEWGGALHR